jgi:hypothetical protein
MLSLQRLFREILAIIHENGDSDATPALGIWSNGFMTSRPHPAPLASSAEASFQSTDLANRTESGVAAILLLLDSGLH